MATRSVRATTSGTKRKCGTERTTRRLRPRLSDVLPPFVIYQTGYLDESRYQKSLSELGARLDALSETDPIPYRMQNGGDYDIPSCELKPGLSAGRYGFDIHLARK
jgi:NAD(P)H dehydrogenase (quinone)